MSLARLKLLAALAAAALLAACASGPTGIPAPAPRAPPPPAVVKAAPAPPVPAVERLRRAQAFLTHGQPALARPELMEVLAEIPGDHAAMSLLDQIDRDPRAILGERNYPYKVRPGETLAGLAERLLGDPLLFYALARYNGVEAPDSVEPGRTILIPGVPRRVAPPAPVAPPVARPAAPPVAAVNPARAAQLRRAALEDMNKGALAQAVALLQQALGLDPSNALIRADLDRALRIQGNLKKR